MYERGEPVKALLLNSGIGKRMGKLTQNTPKCLVEVAPGETILSRQINALRNHNITKIAITTGPFEEQMKAYMAEKFPTLPVQYVPNPLYASTNYIYSMLLAKKYLDEELILMHGDLVFAEVLLKKVIHSNNKNTVLINPTAPLPQKDFKARIKEGYIQEISIDIFGPDCAFLIPLYKLSYDFLQRWLAAMDVFAKRNELTVYAENALNGILADLTLQPLYFDQEFCSEIDDLADLARVRDALAGRT